MENSIQILLIEDNFDDVFLLKKKIKSATTISAFDIVSVDQLNKGINELIKNYYDIVLLDLSLPDSSGIESFQKIFNQGFNIPIIILTGLQDEELALKIVQMGAQDYLLKNELDGKGLIKSILYAIERNESIQQLKREITRRESAFEKINELDFDLKELLIRYKTLMNSVSEILIETNNENICLSANVNTEIAFGKNIIGKKVVLSKKNIETLNNKTISLNQNESSKDIAWEQKEIISNKTIKIGNLYIGKEKS